jgi:hypothetical protein
VGLKILTPDMTIRIGSSAMLRAVVKDESGATLDRPVIWESSNSALVRVEQNGQVTAQGPGHVYVRARFASDSDSVVVTVPMPRQAARQAARDTAHRPDVVEANVPPAPTADNVRPPLRPAGLR